MSAAPDHPFGLSEKTVAFRELNNLIDTTESQPHDRVGGTIIDGDTLPVLQGGTWEHHIRNVALKLVRRTGSQQVWTCAVEHLRRIVLVEDGRVVAAGTHNELMDQSGYAHLWKATTASNPSNQGTAVNRAVKANRGAKA